MLDTVRFLIPHTRDLLKQMQSISKKNIVFDKEGTLIQFHNNAQLNLGSFARGLNFFYSSSQDRLYLELSLPKFYNGHNVYLLYPKDIRLSLHKLYSCLLPLLPSIPPLQDWQVYRIDICYSWKLESQRVAELTMRTLQSLEYPRQKIYAYDSSLMSVGSTYSVKFYLKHQEYYTHDFKELKKIDNDMAMALYDLTYGVLRFEVSLRKKWIEYHYKRLDADQLEHIDYVTLLQQFFDKIYAVQSGKFNTELEAYEKLKKKYNNSTALRLFQFAKIYYSGTPTDRQILKDSLSRISIYKNKRDIKKADVGLFQETNFSLSIPSPYSIN